jgi:hypothetical protein
MDRDTRKSGSPPRRPRVLGRLVITNRGSVRDAREFEMQQVELPEAAAESVDDLATVTYGAVGFCIYCGVRAENLQREHIIPFSLGGNAVLPNASCDTCARITSLLERRVTRAPAMRSARVLRNLSSRSRHRDAPREAVLEVVRNGKSEKVTLPLDEYPILLALPQFGMPGCTRAIDAEDLTLAGTRTLNLGAAVDSVLQKLGADLITVSLGTDFPVEFARMITKIGYSYAVATQEMAKVAEPFPLAPVILGTRADVGRWVGTSSETPARYPQLLHRLALKASPDALFAEVQLFADGGGPTYVVMLGAVADVSE